MSEPIPPYLYDAHAVARARELFTAWSSWCHDSGIKGDEIGSEVAFATSMRVRGYAKKNRNVGAVWTGLMLTGDEGDESP